MGKTKQKLFLDVISYTILIAGAVIMVGPFLWMVATSFKLPADQFTHTFIPNPATLENFRNLFSFDLNFPRLFLISTGIALMSVVGQLFTCAMAAFCFAVVKFRGRNVLFTALLVTLMVPDQVTLIPNFIIFRWLHLVGTSVPLWLPAFWGGAFGTFLLRQYFLTLPRELVDAARVDGASLWDIFWRIYMPLGKPALAALSIFTFQGAWNDLLHPLVYMPNVPNTTLTVGLAFFQTQLTQGGRYTVLMAGAFLSILPLIIVFFFAQKLFVEGIALSGMKR
jgi:ABC-type glycerol-3-phosphate transport system permease component